jgi:hypothetical protein
VENILSALLNHIDEGPPNHTQLEELKSLEEKKNEWLKMDEQVWRLKSRALWLKAGDNNMKFFHNFSNHRKNTNTIWEIKDDEGSKASTFREKDEVGACHFEKLFEAPEGFQIQEILEVVNKFPRAFTEDMNKYLDEEVSEDELKGALFTMQSGKIWDQMGSL